MAQLPNDQYATEWEDTQKQRFDSLLKRNLNELLRESSSEYNFLEVKDKLYFVIEQVKLVSSNYGFWAQLSESKRVAINSAIDEMAAQFDSMATFDPKQNNAWDTRTNLVATFNSRYNTFYDSVATPLSGYLGSKAYSQELAGEFGQQAKKELEEIRRVKKNIEKIEVDVNDAATIAGSVASGAHSVDFGSQALEHKKSAKRWLISLGFLGVAVSTITILVVLDIIKELSDKRFTTSAQGYAIKLAILALLYFAMRFFMRNYSAHQHLYIVNKQRANVLKSMESYRTSAIEESAKDQILLAAVGSAYSQQETGFITTKEGAGSDDGDILSIVNSAIKHK